MPSNRTFSDTLEQQALDRQLFEALSSERGTLWGTVASVLERGANPNAIMHLQKPLTPPSHKPIYLVFKDSMRGWMHQDEIPDGCHTPVGHWGSCTPIGALLTMGSVAAKNVKPVGDDADPYSDWNFFQDADLHEILRLLLDHGADPNAIYAQHLTSTNSNYNLSVTYHKNDHPLNNTVSHLLCRCSELLLAYGADPARLSPDGNHLFDSFNTEHRNAEITRSQLSIIRLLIDAGCVFEDGPQPSETLLGQAAAILNLPLVEGLLALGADPNVIDDHYGNSPLHQLHSLPERNEDTFADELDVAYVRHLTHKIATALLAAGANPAIRNKTGKTAAEMGNAVVSMSIGLFLAEKERGVVAADIPYSGGKPQPRAASQRI